VILALLLAAGAVDCLPPQPIETPCLATLTAAGCVTLPDGSVRCPAGDEEARTCSICVLRRASVDLAGDRATLATQRDGLYTQTEDLARRLAAAVRERDAEHDAALQRARWSLLLGAGGAGGIAAGIALAVHGDGTAGAIAGGLGLVALATGIGLTW
jgi:hypothetical protein